MKINDIREIYEKLPSVIIPRKLHENILLHLKEPEVTILYGARQIGKSVEIFTCILEILKKEAAPDVFYFNLDYPSSDFSHPDAFVNAINGQRLNRSGRVYIFLDEAQRLENIGLFVKYIYDLKLGFKFILTGSASLDIKQKIKEPLTGRKMEFSLMPLSLEEILNFRKIEIEKITGNFELLQTVLADYLLFGGYPGVVTLESLQGKGDRLKEIADSYIQRDLASMFGIEDSNSIKLVASFMAENIGNLFSLDKVSQYSGIKKAKVQKIVEALKKTFVAMPIYPFYKDKSKELIHHPKIYFYDLGVRNAVLNKLDNSLIVAEKGQLFENAIATQLASLYSVSNLKYWRTINQTEVDFIVEKSFNRLLIFEAKYLWGKEKVAKNVASFRENYREMIEEEMIVSTENYWEIFRKRP